MNLARALRDHYFRIDARSLGLFRLTFGLVLVADLFVRWRYLRDFYSNDGVLPNHNHLFNLHATARVWSLLHAFSTPGESTFAFALILVAYLGFLIGFHTRVFHALSLIALVSLTGRNVLLENAGNYIAIALLAFTAFLPLGSRFSLDGLLWSLDARDEKRAGELNDRRRPTEEALDDARLPGWTPTSLAAFAVLTQVAVVYLVSAVQHRSEHWQDGTAMHYSLNVERWVSSTGASARAFLGPGALSLWTRTLRAAEWAIPVLVFLPLGRRFARGAAAGLALFVGLTLGVFFSFGLYGWTLVAAASLLLTRETWDRLESTRQKNRLRTVVYDADCGVCLALSRVMKRLDLRGHLAFQGNDDLGSLRVRRQGGALERISMPAEVTFELVQNTVLAIDHEGRVFTRSRAVAQVVRALPLGWLVAWVMQLPGVVSLLDVLYDAVAARRQNLSVLIGKEACGIDSGPHVAESDEAPDSAHLGFAVAPATRARRMVVGVARELLAATVFAAMLGQTTKSNDLPFGPPLPRVLAPIPAWSRMLARWDILADVPEYDEVFVVDARTRGGAAVDPMTGREPLFDPGAMHGTGLGQLWNDYFTRIRQEPWLDFQSAFRDYLAKSGEGDGAIVGLDAYWVRQPIPRPGEPRSRELVVREKLFAMPHLSDKR